MTPRATLRYAAASAMLALALAVCAGCGNADRKDGSAKVSPGTPYLACLQKHGVPLASDGKEVDTSAPMAEYDNPVANTACKSLATGAAVAPDPADVAHARKVSDCMRRSGFPDYPEPDASGQLHWSGDAAKKFKYDPKGIPALRECDPPAPGSGDGESVRGG